MLMKLDANSKIKFSSLKEFEVGYSSSILYFVIK